MNGDDAIISFRFDIFVILFVKVVESNCKMLLLNSTKDRDILRNAFGSLFESLDFHEVSFPDNLKELGVKFLKDEKISFEGAFIVFFSTLSGYHLIKERTIQTLPLNYIVDKIVLGFEKPDTSSFGKKLCKYRCTFLNYLY